MSNQRYEKVMRVKFGNTTKDVNILEVTPENYIVPKGEESSYHCRIEQKSFDRSTGKRESRPRIQKFEAKMWPMLSRNLKLQGWSIDILYDPTDYLRRQAELAEQTEEQRIKARQEAEAKRKAEERAALKAEILAELKEAGVITGDAKPNKGAKTGGSKK